MSATNDSFTTEYELSAYYVNMHGDLSLPMLINFLIETAAKHADTKGFGFNDFTKLDKTWVLSRLTVKMDTYPQYLDRIRIKTWVRGAERFFFERHLQILDTDGNQLGGAITSWVCIDINSRRPVPIEKVDHQLTYYPEQFAIREKMEKLPPVENSTQAAAHRIEFCELDLNQHLSTMRYAELVINSYPFEFVQTHQAKQFDIQFMKENVWGQFLQVQTQPLEQGEYLHSIWRTDDNAEVTRAKIIWSAKA